MDSICLVRRGHLGDVLMTEPVGRHFRGLYPGVVLATGYPQAQHLIGDTYTGFVHYDTLDAEAGRYARIIDLHYEPHPGVSYIDGYARSAGIVLQDRIPRVNGHWPRMEETDYVLIAPDTSAWRRAQRQWPEERFEALKKRIEAELGLRVVVLGSRHGFTDMLSLIRHCRLFIGNDSGPGIIAQCLQRPALILFGITEPWRVLFSDNAKAVLHHYPGCTDCRRHLYDTGTDCADPVCITGLETDAVFRAVRERLQATAGAA